MEKENFRSQLMEAIRLGEGRIKTLEAIKAKGEYESGVPDWKIDHIIAVIRHANSLVQDMIDRT